MFVFPTYTRKKLKPSYYIFALLTTLCVLACSSNHHPVKSQTGSGQAFPANKKGKR
jgi:hypothetical protein